MQHKKLILTVSLSECLDDTWLKSCEAYTHPQDYNPYHCQENSISLQQWQNSQINNQNLEFSPQDQFFTRNEAKIRNQH